MQGQGLAHGVAEARQHVEHAGRDAGLDGQLGNADGGQRGLLGRFEDHRVAGGQRRAELPAGHQQGEVPRHDGGDHADRLAGHQAQFIVRRGSDFVVDLVDGFAIPADGAGGGGNVDAQGVADRLAHVQGFQQGQLFAVGVDQVGKADQHLLALDRGQARPDAGFEGGAGVLDRQFGVGQVTAGHLSQQAAVDRADAVEGRAGSGVGVLAMDEGAGFDLHGLGALFPICTGQGGHWSFPLIRRVPPAQACTVKNSARPTSGPPSSQP
ncbi:hypothetical protein D3C85_1044640 [compost metagenome]